MGRSTAPPSSTRSAAGSWDCRSRTGSPRGSSLTRSKMARWRRRPEPGTVVRADRGAQCTSWLFGHRLHQAGLLGSTGGVASSVDNALIESFCLRCNASPSTVPSGPHEPSCRRRCSSGSRRSTTPPVGTPRSATSVPWSSNDFTSPPRLRRDQHTGTVRETGSGYNRLPRQYFEGVISPAPSTQRSDPSCTERQARTPDQTHSSVSDQASSRWT